MLRSVYHSIRSQKNRLLNMFAPPVIVLIYHRVTTLESDPHLLAVKPENFLGHMQFLKNNYPVLRFEDDWADVREPSVVVTFDDGYADNALEATPILEKMEAPATFFVSTGSVMTGHEFWWDELERIILGEWSFPTSFELRDGRAEKKWLTATASGRYAMFRELHPMMKEVDYSIREEWLEQLREWANASKKVRESHRPMNMDDLRCLDRCKWATIGAHTVNHSPLSMLTYDKQREEIAGSKEQLERWLGRKIEVFSYPFGTKSDYDRTSSRICRESGFIKAASNFPGQAHRWTDLYQIPRQLVRDWSVAVFEQKMRGFHIS